MAEVEIVDLRAEFKKDPAREKDGAATGGTKKVDQPQSGAAFGAAARRAARQSRRGRAERGVSQPPRLSQFLAMPSLRRGDLVRQLQRQHDLPSARPFAAMPLVWLARARSGSVSGVQRLRTGRAGLRHRAADGGADHSDLPGANRADGQRYQRTARDAPGVGRAIAARRDRRDGRDADDHQGLRFAGGDDGRRVLADLGSICPTSAPRSAPFNC